MVFFESILKIEEKKTLKCHFYYKRHTGRCLHLCRIWIIENAFFVQHWWWLGCHGYLSKHRKSPLSKFKNQHCVSRYFQYFIILMLKNHSGRQTSGSRVRLFFRQHYEWPENITTENKVFLPGPVISRLKPSQPIKNTRQFFLTVLCDPYKLLSLKAEILKSSDMHQC